MHLYSAEELDVMAEAYIRALGKVSLEMSSPDIMRRLVAEIGKGVANGIRDEDELANHALEQTNLGL